MAELEKTHPLDDPEAIEGYVLGTLDQARIQAIDEHLRRCEKCRRAVDEERLLAAGVRRVGRQELKDRLARRAAEQPRTVIPWPRVVAIAAALVVVAGIGILRFWPAHDESTRQESLRDVPAVAESESKIQGNRLQPSDAKPSGGAGKEKTADERSRRKSELLDNVSGNELKNAPEAHIRKEPSLGGASKDLGKIERRDAAEGLAGESTAGGVWTEGTVVTATNTLTAPVPGAAAENVQEASVSGQLQNKAARSAVASKSVQLSQEFVVTQLPARTLPTRQQPLDQRRRPQAIPAYARRVGTQLQLTLYPDSLFTPSDIGSATVDRVGDDSIIVHLGRQRIGYRLPQSFMPQQSRK